MITTVLLITIMSLLFNAYDKSQQIAKLKYDIDVAKRKQDLLIMQKQELQNSVIHMSKEIDLIKRNNINQHQKRQLNG